MKVAGQRPSQGSDLGTLINIWKGLIMKRLLVVLGILSSLWVAKVGAQLNGGVAQTVYEINASESQGPLGDSARVFLERNVYRLKTHCDKLAEISPVLLRSLSKGFGLLIDQYQTRRLKIMASGANQPSVDSLDVNIKKVQSYLQSVERLLAP
jgi:hypothetical protein